MRGGGQPLLVLLLSALLWSCLASSPLLSTSCCSIQGRRSHMEDEVFISRNGDFAAVFDGHGGSKVSSYLRSTLYSKVLQSLPEGDGSWSTELIKNAIRTAVKKCDDDVGQLSQWNHQGSTASVVFISNADGNDDSHDEEDGREASVVCMNVGDSRAVLARGSGEVLELSEDHKPDRADERRRIEKLGGSVKWHGLFHNRKPIAGTGCYRINGNLALSRAVGDYSERPFVSATPDITVTTVRKGDEFICTASDGLWDVFDSQELVSFVLGCKQAILLTGGATAAAAAAAERGAVVDRREVQHALSSFHKRATSLRATSLASRLELFRGCVANLVVDAAFRRGSTDNISCAIVWLK